MQGEVRHEKQTMHELLGGGGLLAVTAWFNKTLLPVQISEYSTKKNKREGEEKKEARHSR